MQSSLRTVLDDIRSATSDLSEADKGHRFEVLMKRYLQTDPTYKARFSDVWLWNEWTYGKGHDVGIDIVAKEADSDRYVAIQCKFYEPTHLMNAHDVDTFFMALNTTIKTEHSDKDSFVSGIIIATTDHWNLVLLDAMFKQHIHCQRIGLSDLEEAPVDWAAINKGNAGDIPKYDARPHQREAIDAVMDGFKSADRGKLIMACGTGKTFTALRLTEEYTGGKGCVLFLAPSIALVAQSLREWMAQTTCKIHPIAVCSDGEASSIDDLADLSARDLPARATTDPTTIAQLYAKFKDSHLTVIFSTYQSIEKLHEAQKVGALPEFDLCICDEAHRTTGVSLLDTKTGKLNESHFVKVHQQDYIACRKRVYMTATPKIYAESARSKAKDANAELASMDDRSYFGDEFFRLPFSRAVREGLLTDYKVLVLCVDEEYVKDIMGEHLKHDETGAIELDDAVRLVGCYNGLRKKVLLPPKPEISNEDGAYDPSLPDLLARDEDFLISDPAPMKRAVAFANKIAISKHYTEMWAKVVDAIRKDEEEDISAFLDSEMRHVDGNMDMGERAALLSWLKGNSGTNDSDGVSECRILSNARCLSEGVDVPSLDAVMFMAPRKSQVDVVQSVGRVMRRAQDKKFGYIILPIGVSPKDKPEDVLDKDEKYKVVWDVLQALRSHDDRFNAEINAIDLNKGRGKRIVVGGVTGKKKGKRIGKDKGDEKEDKPDDPFIRPTLELDFEKELPAWTDGILVRTVRKCGDRRYWEDWAKNIAKIAERQIKAISDLLDKGIGLEEFQLFLSGLRENTNPAITEADAIEMLAQQFISRPVFNALFEKYQFAENNPVSKTMSAMLDIVHDNTDAADLRELRRFYDSVKDRAQSIDNAASRQKVIKELYNNFFEQAFPKMSSKLGIVYTPIPVVDFIVHSVHKVLQNEFGVKDGIGAQGVKILDPFTGTGTFIVRAIQSGLIKRSQLPYKYRNELFACEIVLLSYYIACVNIEVAYHGVMKQDEYEPFNGICLTDTFRMDGNSAADKDLFAAFEDNGERVKNLCKQDIRVIIGNPPYSVGQKSANDNNQNEVYPYLDERIADTYAKNSKATNKNSLYDAYIRAFRWASDRITDDGILAFVTNGSYIDNNAMTGFRQSLMGEYDTIYCFNLRGNQRTSGELSRKEGGKIFGSGSRTPIAIIILVKKKNRPAGQQATLHYHDIGDYLSREQKLDIITGFGNYSAIPWQILTPDEHGDWLNHRTSGYEKFLPIGDKATKGKNDTKAAFSLFSRGVATARDAWCYNYSRSALESNMRRSIEFFNTQSGLAEFDYDPTKFSWGRQQKKDAERGKQYCFSASSIVPAVYRPFCKRHGYIHKDMNDMLYQMPKLFPTAQHKNLVITIPALAGHKFMPLISDVTCDLHMNGDAQCFPLYWYEKRDSAQGELNLGMEDDAGNYIRHDGISNFGLKQFRTAYGDPKISKEDIFYYVYGLLHSTEYRTRFENDLKKELPRIPFAKDFRAFSKAGRKLAELHLNYETIEPWPVKEESHGNFRVTKMRFPKKGIRHTIHYNDTCTLSEIPDEAYEYIVNGKSAIEWLMERYAVTTDKDSGIVNDPNDWCDEQGNPRYIIDLVKRVIRVSIETMEIVKALPALNEL
ncbi:MAG: DEAD/DEAH box helicase [Akkermansia sp.]|nr:DEAD/DEAH box helicase [Akkermansia sp.]